MTEQLKQAIIESGKQYFRSIIIRGVWRVEQKVMRVCHKPHPIRPERAEALSPGHRPGF